MDDAEVRLPPRFFSRLAVNLSVSVAINWILIPEAVSLLGIRFYGMTGSAERLTLTELWVSQGYLAIAGTCLTFLFWLRDWGLWAYFVFFTALVWGGHALMELVASPEPGGTLTALLFLAVPLVQVAVAAIVSNSWKSREGDFL